MTTLNRPYIGRIWYPEASRSYPGGGKCERTHWGVLTAVQRKLVRPEDAEYETVWASITHNERVDRGASITINRLFGTVGQANNGVFTALAVGGTGGTAPNFTAGITKTKTDLSLGIITSGVQTNEATTVGLARAAGTPQNLGAAPGALDGNQSVDVQKTFTLGGGATIFSAGLFDQVVAAASNLYVEDNFSSSATLANTDSFVTTWSLSQ